MTTTSTRRVLRGLVAVLVLLISAVDALVTAAVGLPPIAWCVRRFAAVVRDAYRLGRFGPPSTCTDLESFVFEGVIVDDE